MHLSSHKSLLLQFYGIFVKQSESNQKSHDVTIEMIGVCFLLS